MATIDIKFVEALQIVKGFKFNNWDITDTFNDDDINGSNGTDFITESARENGFDNDLDYWTSNVPHIQPKSVDDLEENWEYICSQLEQSSSYYLSVNTSVSTVEIDESTMVVVARAVIRTNT